MMFGYFDGLEPESNGPNNIKFTVKLNKNSAVSGEITASYNEIKIRKNVMKKVRDKLKLKSYDIDELRLFNTQGLELYDQDFRFIENGSTLFVSRGEDFDMTTYYSEYEKVKDLGKGGFGEVFLGRHKIDGSKVAIKVTNPEAIDTAKDVDMVFAEAETLKCLNHSNIVKMHNCFLIKKTLQAYFIMEFLEGGELLDYITGQENGYLQEDEALHIFKQLISAIDYCHRMKIIHRDLKLENILRVSDTSDQFKIVDFGIAGLCAGRQSESTNAGSLNYMAPEVFIKKGIGASPALDIWALGCILYAMVTGKLPFKENSDSALKRKIIEEEPKFPKEQNFSEELIDLIRIMMKKNPEKRAGIYEILQHPWYRGKKFEKIEAPILEQIGEIEEEDDDFMMSKKPKVRFDNISVPPPRSKARKKSGKPTKSKKGSSTPKGDS